MDFGTREIDDLADKIRTFGEANLNTRDASRQFEAALDDVTTSLSENGTTLDITTEAGRKNEQALDDVAQAALDLAAATVEQTGKQEDANKVIQSGRDQLIKMLSQFGITGQAAEDYADELGLIPDNVTTAAKLTGVSQAEAELAALARNRTAYITAVVNRSAENDFYQNGGVNRPGFASGGTLYGPTNILAGEAGPEAIVPLDRPLHLVDESVRWLSAIAQGRSMPAMAAGGTVGRSAPLWQGDMVIQDKSGDPRRTGNEAIMRLFERAGSGV